LEVLIVDGNLMIVPTHLQDNQQQEQQAQQHQQQQEVHPQDIPIPSRENDYGQMMAYLHEMNRRSTKNQWLNLMQRMRYWLKAYGCSNSLHQA
jgi:hypothetical protein